MIRKTFLLFAFLAVVTIAFAQAPSYYYTSVEGLTGEPLKIALHNIIKGHFTISYGEIWNAFWSTDNKGNGVVWDMYSDRPGGTPPYTFELGMDQCGNYSGEGDCYNREHSWPQSWFNEQSTPRTDLHHIFATDGHVNWKRSSYPYGEVRSASWTSLNGSKLGSCMTPGYTGTVFEPIDAYKGDFARAYFYMSVRYYGEDTGWKTSDMTDKSVIKPWAMAMLLRWNDLDPVSQKEIDRNNAIYNDYQRNRNPFVDHPEFARMIWDPNWSVDEYNTSAELQPDQIIVYDLCGRKLLQTNIINEEEEIASLKNKLQHGCYFLQILSGNRVLTNKKLLVN